MKKVRVNATYRFVPCNQDKWMNSPFTRGQVKVGDVVKVVNQYGCPPANTMGQCYIEKDGKFLGMVSVHSLHPKKCPVQVGGDMRPIDDAHACTCP